MTNIRAITIGDINGIGIELLISLWKKKKIKKFILFTDTKVLVKILKKRKINIQLNIINENNNNLSYNEKKLNIYSYKSISEEDNTLKSINFAYKFCFKKICIGIITLPLRKDLIKKRLIRNL